MLSLQCQGVDEGLKYVGQMKDLVDQMRATLHLGRKNTSSAASNDEHDAGIVPHQLSKDSDWP